MCGIVGYISEKIDQQVLESMMEQIVHRGPDGSGRYLDQKIALGHRRLSIIDAAGGAQPMKNEDGSLICIFNGEIYNYRELRQELIHLGHRFASDSDTEVLLHGYEAWGSDLLLKLRGMFAFVLWDRVNQQLFCARDYFGIKPFYYYQRENAFLFGSEIKCFLPHPDFVKELNEDQIELYLTYQYSPGNETFFKGVYQLPPAHFMVWKAGQIEIKRYWKPEFAPNETVTEKEWINKIRSVMDDSVKAHKISDVEVGSFLSSGVDSSYVTALAYVDKTFSVGYAEEAYDESSQAHAFSEKLHVKNNVYQIQAAEYWKHLSQIQYQMDEPLADAASVALYFLNREAAKQVKVCLSGEGADELFGGYRIYRDPFICRKYDRVPRGIRYLIGTVAEYFPERWGRNFLVRHKVDLAQRYIGNTSIFTPKEKKKMLKSYAGKKAPTKLARSFFHEPEKADTVTRMQYTDLHLWLVGDILLKADKMSMAHSLELRVPFLDKEVFSVASQIPTVYRVNQTQTKIALRRAAKELVGEDCAKKEKLGFPVPVREWLREEPYASMVWASFTGPVAEKFFHTRYLTRLLEEHLYGVRDNWRKIWCVYMFILWYEEYFVKR